MAYQILPYAFIIYVILLSTQTIDSLRIALKGHTHEDTTGVNILNSLAYQGWIQGDDSVAKNYAQEAILLARKLNYHTGESNARFQLVRIEMDILEEVDAAFAHLDTVDALAQKIKDPLMQGISYFRRAQLISSTRMDNPEEVEELLDSALALFIKEDSNYWESLIYAEKAELQSWDGNYAQAIELLLKARELQERIKDVRALRATLPNLGVNYVQVEMFKEALECFDAAEEVAIQLNDLRVMAFVNNQRGDIYKKQNEFEKALKSYSAAADIYLTTKSNQFLPSVYARMSDIYLKMGNWNDALKFNLKSDSVFKANNSKNAIYHYSQINFGNLYLGSGDYPKVIDYAKKGLASIGDLNTLLFEKSNYHRQLSEAYFALGNHRLAYDHLRSHKLASDSLFNDESRQKIMSSTMAYQIDKLKTENDIEIQALENQRLTQSRNFLMYTALASLLLSIYILWVNRRLKKYNTQLITKNREIEMALDRGQKIERRRVASELHDNLNTKLAALRWSLESIDTKDWDSNQQSLHKKLIEMANDAYKDVRLISHNMLPPELEREGLSAAFHILFQKLNELGDIKFHYEEQNMKRLSPNHEHQLYNIALEGINNALKHAKATKVHIQVSIENHQLVMTVKDNGVGMNEIQIQKGMGFHNVKNRAESIGGQIKVDSTPEKGTKLTVWVNV